MFMCSVLCASLHWFLMRLQRWLPPGLTRKPSNMTDITF
jgi:hypothetical protein